MIVHSRRTRARIPFWFRKDRAREVFRLVARLAREHQDRLAQAQRTGRPPAPEPPGALRVVEIHTTSVTRH